jgi:hypothetical protein
MHLQKLYWTTEAQKTDADLQEDVAAEVYADLKRQEPKGSWRWHRKDGSQLFVQKQSAKKAGQIVTDRHGGTKKIGHCCTM